MTEPATNGATLTPEIAVSPKSADTAITAGVYGGLFVTTDGGAHWKELAGPNGRVTAVRYATNGGKTFRPVGRDLNRSNLLISDFTNPTSAPIQFSPAYGSDHTVYAIAQQTIVKSTDGAQTWTQLKFPSAQTFLARASRIATPPSTGTVRATAPTSAMPDVKNNSSNGVWYIVAIGAGAGLVLLGVYLWSRRGPGSDPMQPKPTQPEPVAEETS